MLNVATSWLPGAAPGAELEATVREVVEHGGPLGVAHRVVGPGAEVEDARTQVDPLGRRRGEVAQEDLAGGDVAVLGERVVLADPHVLPVVRSAVWTRSNSFIRAACSPSVVWAAGPGTYPCKNMPNSTGPWWSILSRSCNSRPPHLERLRSRSATPAPPKLRVHLAASLRGAATSEWLRCAQQLRLRRSCGSTLLLRSAAQPHWSGFAGLSNSGSAEAAGPPCCFAPLRSLPTEASLAPSAECAGGEEAVDLGGDGGPVVAPAGGDAGQDGGQTGLEALQRGDGDLGQQGPQVGEILGLVVLGQDPVVLLGRAAARRPRPAARGWPGRPSRGRWR